MKSADVVLVRLALLQMIISEVFLKVADDNIASYAINTMTIADTSY